MSAITCPGIVTTSSLGDAQCTNGSGTALAWTYVPDFDFSQLDPASAGGAFSAGFCLIGIGWVLGKLYGVVLDILK